MPSVPRSVAEPALNHEININGTFNVLMAAREAALVARRLRRFQFGLRRHRDAAETGGDVAQPSLALRGGETLRRYCY